MTLSKRTVLLILPVILISYLMAVIGAYAVQKRSITRLEESRLMLQLTELAAQFAVYSSFADSYVHAITQNQFLYNFLTERENHYKKISLSRSLEDSLKQLQHYTTSFSSFAIIDRDGVPAFYFENSLNPFSQISAIQLQQADKIFNEGKLSNWEFVRKEDGKSLIIQSFLVDERTTITPLASQLEQSVLVQLVIEPSTFDVLVKRLEQRYKTTIQFSQTPPKSDAHSAMFGQIKLGDKLYASVSVNDHYTAISLLEIKQLLINSFIVMSCFSGFILLWLIRKHITRPISQLEHELTELISQQRQTLTVHYTDDEVGRLTRTFQQLYNQLSDAFRKTRALSERDNLTELPNRSKFQNCAHLAIEHANQKQSQIALLYIDLDNFKFVNDKHGHQIGDKLLKAFALRLLRVTYADQLFCGNSTDCLTLARLGGDEFALLIEDLHSDQQATHMANSILNILEGGFHFDQGHFPISASIGIARYPEDALDAVQLVSAADAAMYQAKSAGKNQYTFYSRELAASERRKKEIETELHSLVCNDEFFLVFMPICDATSLEIVGCETLVRWISPTLGFVSPAEFIPISETTGSFSKIDRWVIDTALKSYPDLTALFGAHFKLSINLSSAELSSPSIGEHIRQRIAEYGISPQNIELEMTETFGIDYNMQAMDLLKSLRNDGFSIAIDDFGTGYTSLIQMVDYPVDKIKLDKTFIDRLTHTNKQRLLLPLIQLCHSQNIQVTAEGIETWDQALSLRNATCDYLQGFYFGKPMTLEELTEWSQHLAKPNQAKVCS